MPSLLRSIFEEVPPRFEEEVRDRGSFEGVLRGRMVSLWLVSGPEEERQGEEREGRGEDTA